MTVKYGDTIGDLLQVFSTPYTLQPKLTNPQPKLTNPQPKLTNPQPKTYQPSTQTYQPEEPLIKNPLP